MVQPYIGPQGHDQGEELEIIMISCLKAGVLETEWQLCEFFFVDFRDFLNINPQHFMIIYVESAWDTAHE